MTAAGSDPCVDANMAAAYVAGELTMREAEAVEKHIDRCADCRQHLSELARSHARLDENTSPAVTPTLVPGTRVGRYVIVERLGAGAMGVVYRARDPELGRPIALKMVRSELANGAGPSGDTLHDRLAREARAMAQLSHPNVVAVYDLVVEGGALYIAMELIDGTSLATWLTQAPRGWPEVLRVFRQAGEGLAAAHAAGLVHRDFKPDNVLVDDARGRVCVTDFGLARLDRPAESPVLGISHTAPALAAWMTTTGALMGTPAYMSPEQYRSDPATPHSDQFSFCVALYEALHRESPFEGETVQERAAAVTTGRRRPRSKDAIPARIDEVLERGMRIAPAERYASMRQLVAALSPSPVRSLRYGAAALVLVAMVVGTTMFVRRRHSPATASAADCPSADQRLAGVWDSARKQRIEAAFEATKKTYALDAWRGTERSLERYVDDWSGMYTTTCSRRPYDVTRLRSMTCLEERLVDLRALVDVLELADAALVGEAVPAAESLARVAQCNGHAQTALRVAPPSTPEVLAKVTKVTSTSVRSPFRKRADARKRRCSRCSASVERTSGGGRRSKRSRYSNERSASSIDP